MSFTAGQFPSVLKIAELFPGQDNVFNTTLLAYILQSDGLVVKSLDSETRDPVFTTTGGGSKYQEFLGT